ncbi:MAG: hypothetical protein ABW321_23580 [Polyangiales bacterium]
MDMRIDLRILALCAVAGCSLNSEPVQPPRGDAGAPTWRPQPSPGRVRDGGGAESESEPGSVPSARDAATPDQRDAATPDQRDAASPREDAVAGSPAAAAGTTAPPTVTPPPPPSAAGASATPAGSAGASGEPQPIAGSDSVPGSAGAGGAVGDGGMPGLVDSVDGILGSDADPDQVEDWRDKADEVGELDPAVVVPAFTALVQSAICFRDRRACIAACFAIAADCSKCAPDMTCRELVQRVCGPLANGCDAP